MEASSFVTAQTHTHNVEKKGKLTMNERMLMQARIDLLDAQTNLALCRKYGFEETLAAQAVCRALDRAWDVQCMVQGVFH